MARADGRESRYCWKCRSYYPPDVKICLRCGQDLETGQELASGVDAAPEEKPGVAGRVLMFTGEWMPGLLRPWIIAVSILTALLGLGVMWLFLFVLPTVLPARLIFAATGLVLYAHAIGFMMSGRISKLHEALVEIEEGQWVLFFTILLLPPTALIGLVALAAGVR